MSDQHSSLSVGSYSQSQAAEHMLNTAITQAKISESFEEYLEIFDKDGYVLDSGRPKI